MTLWLIAAFVGGFALRSVAPPLARAVRRDRVPLQLFAGRVFPHPLDERWLVTTGRAALGTGRAALGSITVTRQHIYGSESGWTRLRIGDVEIDGGKRAENYLVAIENAARERTLAKALEAIP